MATLIKQFSGGSILEFDRGKFDDWCVYLTRPGQERYAPKDIQYFQQLVDFAEKYSKSKLYRDFVYVFHATKKALSNIILDNIGAIAKDYEEDAVEVEILLSIIYAGMVAEENKDHSILGKRVKRLGIHQIIFDGFSPEEAAIFSKGKPWREIDKECKLRGF